jgi:HEPN domain-containing protein
MQKREINLKDYKKLTDENSSSFLENMIKAYGTNDYFSTALWGAVFLESYLEEVLKRLKFPVKNEKELNELISRLRQYINNPNPVENAIKVPDEIVKRSDDVRNIRNRLVHNTGAKKETIEEDAKLIHSSIVILTDWFIDTFAKEGHSIQDAAKNNSDHLIPVFFSSINPHTIEQALFIDAFLEKITEMGIKPVRCIFNTYDQKDPVGKVSRVIKECRGIIVLGLERTHSYFMREKERSEKEKEFTHVKYTSGWLHLEAGIAAAYNLEVFVICEKDIFGEGVFDRSWFSYPINEIENLDIKDKKLLEFFNHLQEWIKSVQENPLPSQNIKNN